MRKNKIAVRPEELIEARYKLTSKENDIIDMVLNTIKDDGKYVYEIDLQKYKKLYKDGLTNIYRDLKKATKELFDKHNKFYIKDKMTGQEYNFVWFSMLSYNDTKGSIYFEVGYTLKQLLLEMQKRIYYKLNFTLNFNSIYSKRIYYMLKSFQDTGWRTDKIDELRYKLNCPSSYKNYAIFKEKVLDKAYDEINSKSDISFKYKTEKTGRKVTRIKFYIESKIKDEVAASCSDDKLILDEASKRILTFIKEKLTLQDEKKIMDAAGGNMALIKEKYEIAQIQGGIKNIVSWLIYAIKNDYKMSGIVRKKPTAASNERQYDADELEKKLLAGE